MMAGGIKIATGAPGLGTQAEWRGRARREYGCRSWREAARRHARQHGRAVVMLADDSALVIRRDDSRARGVTESTHKAECVLWIHGPVGDNLPADMPPELA